jgi:uncharacterized protein with HEPN domain
MWRKRWYGLTKDDSVYLEHILDEIAFLTSHVESLKFEDLLEDELLQRGVIRSLEIIGEASKNVSPGLKEAYPQIEWKMMAAMRDKLIHRYFQVNWRIVWNVLTMEIPSLRVQIEKILREQQANPPSQDKT